MTTNLSSLRLDIENGLATVTLTQPARGNPIDGDFTRDFKEVFLELWDTQGLRAVLLRAEGSNFSFGGDLKTFHPVRHALPAMVRRLTSDFHVGLSRAWQLPVPIVAEVQGWAMGGAVGLLAGCDVVVAAESARFGSAFSHLGFSCDSGSSVTLTFRMGAARARRFVLMGEVLSSAEALAAGLADQVVPDAQLTDSAREIAVRLATGPTLAYGEIKRLFLRAGHAQLEAQLEDEALTLARISATEDAQEGVAAMFERRKASFRGR
ncbi:enoyl-CoA hydratase-related protein [Variovorax sp. LjRoot290]|uniref:enoyl-CoA hydratase/isomerase family protein n=1 Tax=unclassified Variovorax TaxID=663243 RepID=UPI003ECDEB37